MRPTALFTFIHLIVAVSRIFYDKKISQEVPGDTLGDEWKGYIFRITGGNDKQGFPMKQGVLLPHRVRLLLSDGHSCYRTRRTGERRRKSVRGCIVGPDIAVLSLVIVKQGEGDIPGLTDSVLPKRLGPKRATKIRKFFNLSKEDDVRKYVIRREVKSLKKENAKPYTKAYVVSCSSLNVSSHDLRPKIQRLVTPQRLQRRRRVRTAKRQNLERQKENKAEYEYVTSLSPLSKLIDHAVLSLPSVFLRRRQKQLQQRQPTRPPHKSSLLTYMPLVSNFSFMICSPPYLWSMLQHGHILIMDPVSRHSVVGPLQPLMWVVSWSFLSSRMSSAFCLSWICLETDAGI